MTGDPAFEQCPDPAMPDQQDGPRAFVGAHRAPDCLLDAVSRVHRALPAIPALFGFTEKAVSSRLEGRRFEKPGGGTVVFTHFGVDLDRVGGLRSGGGRGFNRRGFVAGDNPS